ncbi:MAG: metal-dependent transcriptional regulator [Coriobacteriia bacterium]|nr:metal-dependent transcriptional regulator [Coriobacteriia bacterium]
MPSATMEEYLELVYKLSEKGDVRPTQIAEALGVSGPTVTSALKRLEIRGLITRPDGAVVLTEEGRREALDIIRRHRLSERFLVDVLGLSWEEVHDEACRLEHALSPKVMEALEAFMERPESCPHGHPIPTAAGEVREVEGVPLCESGGGQRVEIVQVSEDDHELLPYLASLGMFPGREVEVCEVAPFRGPLLVNVAGSQYALGREVAAKILVRPAGKGRLGMGRRKR